MQENFMNKGKIEIKVSQLKYNIGNCEFCNRTNIKRIKVLNATLCEDTCAPEYIAALKRNRAA